MAGVESAHNRQCVSELTGPAETLIRSASEIAAKRNHGIVGTEHLLLAMIRQSSDSSVARRLLDEAGATEELRRRLEEVLGPD
jgi:ATP-dependent Clp protease ATP-binding subunit ClpA